MDDYKKMLSSLDVKALKGLIKEYMSHLKITVSKKTKEELIEHIMKHTDLKGDKIVLKDAQFNLPETKAKPMKETKAKRLKDELTFFQKKKSTIKSFNVYVKDWDKGYFEKGTLVNLINDIFFEYKDYKLLETLPDKIIRYYKTYSKKMRPLQPYYKPDEVIEFFQSLQKSKKEQPKK